MLSIEEYGHSKIFIGTYILYLSQENSLFLYPIMPCRLRLHKGALFSSKCNEFPISLYSSLDDFMIFCRLFDMNTPRVKDLPDEDSLSLYAVLNVWEPPRRLLSRSTK